MGLKGFRKENGMGESASRETKLDRMPNDQVTGIEGRCQRAHSSSLSSVSSSSPLVSLAGAAVLSSFVVSITLRSGPQQYRDLRECGFSSEPGF